MHNAHTWNAPSCRSPRQAPAYLHLSISSPPVSLCFTRTPPSRPAPAHSSPGSFTTVTKYTSDAANGGQICLTEETYRQLPARSLLRRAWVLHMGQHHLGDYYTAVDEDDCEFQLYQVGKGEANGCCGTHGCQPQGCRRGAGRMEVTESVQLSTQNGTAGQGRCTSGSMPSKGRLQQGYDPHHVPWARGTVRRLTPHVHTVPDPTVSLYKALPPAALLPYPVTAS